MKTIKRNSSIYFIKVVAMMLVVGIHFLNHIGYYKHALSGPTMFLFTAIYPFLMCGVPLFLITSGYLLSNREIDSYHYKNTIDFILLSIILVAIVTLLNASLKGTFSIREMFDFFKNVLLEEPFYYIPLYLNLYLIAPFLNKLFYSVPKSKRKYLLFVSAFIVSLPRFMNSMLGIQFFEYRYINAFPVLYYLIGLAFKEYNWNKEKFKYSFLIIIGIGLIFSSVMFLKLDGRKFERLFGNYENIFIVLTAVFLFYSLHQINISSPKFIKVATIISSASFSCYVINQYFSDKIILAILPQFEKMWMNSYLIIAAAILSPLITLPIGLIANWIADLLSSKVHKTNKLILSELNRRKND